MGSLKSELNRTQTILLSVIAICLVLITVKMYIPETQAHPFGLYNGWNDKWDLRVEYVMEKCSATGHRYKIECP